MSFTACAWAFKVRDLRAPERHVLLVLANYADERGMCWPSQRHLADATGYSERTIRDALGKLEDSGYVDRRGRRGEEQVYRSDEIYLLMPEDMIDANPKSKPSGKSFRRGAKNHEEPAADSAGATGSSCRSDRQDVPVSQRQELPPILSDSTLSSKPIRDTAKRAGREREVWPRDAFDQFWAIFPDKTGKAYARKCLQKIEDRGDVKFDAVIDGVHRYIKNKPKDRAWCHPSTFINQERWDDEPAANDGYATLHQKARAMTKVAI